MIYYSCKETKNFIWPKNKEQQNNNTQIFFVVFLTVLKYHHFISAKKTTENTSVQGPTKKEHHAKKTRLQDGPLLVINYKWIYKAPIICLINGWLVISNPSFHVWHASHKKSHHQKSPLPLPPRLLYFSGAQTDGVLDLFERLLFGNLWCCCYTNHHFMVTNEG